MATSGAAVDRESNQALLFRLSTALKKVDRLKSAQANVLHRMEVARRITPGRDGSSRKENFFSPKQIVKGKMEKRIMKSPLQSLSVNVAGSPAHGGGGSSLFAASPVSKSAEHGVKKDLRLQVPASPMSFKEALLTPVKKKQQQNDEDNDEKPLAAITENKSDIGVTWSEVTLEEVTLDDVTLTNECISKPKPKQLTFGDKKKDVNIVIDSIAAKDKSSAAKANANGTNRAEAAVSRRELSNGNLQQVKEVEEEASSSSMMRALKRALKKEVQEKNAAAKAVEEMHGKVEDMHRHVQIAYKMKKVAEKNLSKTVGDLQMNQMERETEINELKKRISEMREEHERYHSRSEQKMAKLRNALRNSQADLSGLEIHLHQYEKQVNRLQAQIELLRRNMLTSQRGIHHTTEVVGQTNPSDLSPLSCLTTESSTYSGHSYSRRRRTPESYYTALQNYTPSILDALNIDMI